MDVERIKARIAELAESPKNVRFQEIERLLENHIRHLYGNYNHHQSSSHHAFTVGGKTFTITEPNSGALKVKYVKHFLEAMEELGLYERED